MKYIFKFTLLMLILSGIVVAGVTLKNYRSTPQAPKKILLGAWTEGLFDPAQKKLHPEKLIEFEEVTKKKVSIAHYYRGWESLSDPNVVTEFATLRKNNWQPMLNVNPYYFSECETSEVPLYRNIANGKCDKFLHRAGKVLSEVEEPFFLLFAWEMNNHDNAWSISKTGSTSADFITAWRHIHAIFKTEKANNIKWVFAPNIPDVKDYSYASLYPGDDYVDWIGLDGYNWGTTQSWSKWSSFSDVFSSPYKTITTIAPHKPLMLSEVNTTDQGGDKSAWYKDMFEQIPSKFPKIEAVVIFNEDKTQQERVNWKVNITPESLNAYSSGIQSDKYK